jgi:hypothetical protein
MITLSVDYCLIEFFWGDYIILIIANTYDMIVGDSCLFDSIN